MVHRASLSRTTLFITASLCTGLAGLVYLVDNRISRALYLSTEKKLSAINQGLRSDLRAYFLKQIQHAKELVKDSQLKKLLAQLAAGQKVEDRLRSLLSGKAPASWKDIAAIDRANNLFFSHQKTINAATLNSLVEIAPQTSVMLEPTIGEFTQIAATQEFLLPLLFPVIANGVYIATLVVALDYQELVKIIDDYSTNLPRNSEINLAQEKRGTVSVLFASPQHVKPFEKTYIVQDLIPVARACNGDFGASVDWYENQWISSVRDYSPHLHWAVTVQTNLTTMHLFLSLLSWISIIAMIIGILLFLYLLLTSLSIIATFINPIIFAALSLSLFGFLGASYYYMSSFRATYIEMYQSNISQAKIDTQYLAALLLQHSFAIQTVVHNQVQFLNGKKISSNLFVSNAKEEIKNLKHDFGKSFIGISYFDEQHKLISQYVSPDNTAGAIDNIAFTSFLQTTSTAQWVSSAQQKELGPDVYNFYVEPFFNDAQQLAGYVWATLSYHQIKNVLSLLGQNRLHDIIIFDANNTTVFLSYSDWVRNRVNSIDIQKYYGTQIVKDSFEKAVQGQSGSFAFKNTQGEPWFMLYEFLPDMKWTLSIFTKDASLHTSTPTLHHLGVLALVFLVCALFCACGLLTYVFTLAPHALKLFAVLYALLLILGMGGTIYLNYRYTETTYKSRAITSRLRSINLQNELQEKTDQKYIPIKTHVMLEFINIVNPNNIHFTAIVEQSINRALYPDVKLGVELANRSSNISLQEIDRKKDGTIEKVIYRAVGTVHQVHQVYSQMPFDMEEIGLWFSPADHINNVLLIPDLERYNRIDPTDKPGVSEQFLLKDYEIRLSYFTYEMVSQQPVLVFTLLTQRNLLSVLLEYFLPLLVILFSIFLITIVSGQIPLEYQLAVIAAISGLFFALILLHQKFRSSLAISQFSYLEASILIVYVGLGYGYLDALYLINKPKAVFYKALLYWPAIITYLFGVTTITFM
jgi:hypothetical protein